MKNRNPKQYFILFFFIVPYCLAQSNIVEEKKIHFRSGDETFSGKIFLPAGDKPFPSVVILHGGSSNVKAHRATSSYYGRRFAKRGIAAIIYDKRGTGSSGGEVTSSTFDDFVKDAISAVKFLKKQDEIDSKRIGMFGPSQGGRIAALAAARSPDVSFIVTLAAPLTSIADLMYFSTMDILQYWGIIDSLKQAVEPLWAKHFIYVENDNKPGLKKLDLEIDKLSGHIEKKFLPLKSFQLNHLKDFGKGDFQPQYNSMTKDYISELAKVKVPWISIYAEFDKAVPVEASIRIMRQQMALAENEDYEIRVIPDVDHGFKNVKTKKYIRVEELAIDWVLEKLQ